MSKKTMEDLERESLDRQRDRELEATFPASDALKITHRQPSRPASAPATTEKK
jgi:hypothetical protein